MSALVAAVAMDFTLVQIDATRNDLYITFSDRAGAITLHNWSNGNSGITLEQMIRTPAAPPVNQTIMLDNPNYAGLSGAAHSTDLLVGGAGNDLVWGNGGSDAIYGGDEVLFCGVGDDLIKMGNDCETVLQSHAAGGQMRNSQTLRQSMAHSRRSL